MIGEKFLFLPQITVILFCQAQDLDHGKKKKLSWTHEDKGKTIAYEPPKNRCECLKTPLMLLKQPPSPSTPLSYPSLRLG